MSVGIYSEPTSSALLSQDDLFTKPFAITFNGKTGGYKEVKLYLRNDNPLYFYTDLELALEDSTSPTIINRPSDGFIWKMSYGDNKPTYNDWLNTPVAQTLTGIDDLGASGSPDTSTYLPFWVFIQVPANLDVQVFTGVKFVVSGNEGLV